MTGPSTELDDFERVVHEHAAAAYRVAVVLVGEPSAPGLLAEAVHEAWRRGPAPRDPARVAPWMHRIVVQRGRVALRRAAAVREIPVTPLLDTGHGAVEAHADLADALQALPIEQRAVLALRHAGGLADHDLAEALQVHGRSAASRLDEATAALRHRSGIPGGTADTRVEAFLASLGERRVPLGLADGLVAAVRAEPGRGPSARLVLLAAAVGLLVVTGLALFAGWTPPIDLLPGSQGTPSPAATPTPAPSPGASVTAGSAGLSAGTLGGCAGRSDGWVASWDAPG